MAELNDPGLKRPEAPVGQLRFFQGTTLLLALALLCGGGYYLYRQNMQQPMAILVNGKPVATASSLAEAANIIRLVHSEQVGPEYIAKNNPRFTESIGFAKAADQIIIDSTDAAAAKLSAATHTVVDADAILVDNKPVVALPDSAIAQEAVDQLRDHYAAMPPDGPPLEKPRFVQTVNIEKKVVPAKLAKRNADDAAAVLWTPPPPLTYTVKFHETGWSIARKFKLKFGDFLRANAGHDVNRLTPGDSVVVSKTFPPVDVIVTKQEQKKESFGGTGLRELTVKETYIDGVLSGTPVATNMIMLQRATPRQELN
jgi:LysM repeat protein